MKKNLTLLLVLVFLTASSAVIAEPASSDEITENSWTTKSPMPQAISGIKAAVANGKIYVMGADANYEYDPVADNWTAKTPMPTPRRNFGIVTCQNKIYVIGGDDTGLNEVYDPSIDHWTTKASMPTPREGMAANAVDGKIYVIGGILSGENIDDAVFYDVNEVYYPETDTWTTKASIPKNAGGYSSVVVDKKIYVIGNLTQIYNTATDGWSYGTPIPTIVQGAGIGATTGNFAPKRIYVFGGIHYNFNFFETVNLTQVYDPESDVWAMGSPMPKARTGLCVAIVDDVLYALGGNSAIGSGTMKYPISGGPYDTNELYTPAGYNPAPSPESSPSPEPIDKEPFPTTLVVASVITVAAVGIGLLVYFKKRKH